MLVTQAKSDLEALWKQYEDVVRRVQEAFRSRQAYSHYPEIPSGTIYGENANAEGLKRYQQQVGQRFDRLLQRYDAFLESDEVSPYTREPLRIQYPVFHDPNRYIEVVQEGWDEWKRLPVHERVALLIEALERIKGSFFEIAYATMHTTGQGFMMAFQASGPHANDRGLEALVLGYELLSYFPSQAEWEKDMGKQGMVKLKKFYIPVPKGVALVIGCSTFPIWNSMPAIFADLVTANPVIVKPHPRAIYPLAIVVSHIQSVLKAYGFSPELIVLAPDKVENPITKVLAEHPSVKVIDYTGGPTFGTYLEQLKGKEVFTEKAGVNSVILESVTNLKAVMQNLAFSVSLYSGQMCTCPQNFFIPKTGIQEGDRNVPYEEVVQAFVDAVKDLAFHPKAGPAVLGAIQNDQTWERVEKAKTLGKILLEPRPIQNPDFPNARTLSPLILEVSPDAYATYSEELFGPIVLVIPTENTEQSIALAKRLVREKGAIAVAAYTTKPEMIERIARELTEVSAPLAFNLTGPIYMNQNAAFSDIHVTGGNPAGNASFTDTAFLSRRFNWVEIKYNPITNG